MCKINCPLRAVIKKRQAVIRMDTNMTDRSGKTIPVRMNTAGLFDAYQVKAKQAGVNLELENEEELPIIEADANRLRRVFTNLLDNALKFSKNDGTVTILTDQTEKDIVVKVKDEGIGIDPQDLPFIFESFNRGKGAEKKKGFGLGLATVKAIVEAHGGQVLVKSELGKESIFKVILPKERVEHEPLE